MFKVIKKEGHARRGEFLCAHGGAVQTPVFMNVGTQAAIKGGVDAFDLHDLGCQIELSNTYHLHLRPGDDVVRQMGGLHRFMNWDGPILTDSGGFQVFSLASLRKIKEADDSIETAYITSVSYGNFTDLEYADGYSVESTLLSKSFVNKAQKAGKQIYVWTVNSEERLEKVVGMGIDNVITDDPVMAKELIVFPGFLGKIIIPT